MLSKDPNYSQVQTLDMNSILDILNKEQDLLYQKAIKQWKNRYASNDQPKPQENMVEENLATPFFTEAHFSNTHLKNRVNKNEVQTQTDIYLLDELLNEKFK